jgi:hypothetical protein
MTIRGVVFDIGGVLEITPETASAGDGGSAQAIADIMAAL